MIVVAFSPDEKKIFTASDINGARLWDLNGDKLADFDNKTSSICAVAFSPDGKKILSGSFDGTSQLWDIEENSVLLELKFIGHNGRIELVAFSPDGKTILTGSNDGTVRLWDLKRNSFRVFKGHTDNVISVAFSPDGKRILTGSLDDFLRSDKIEPLSAQQKKQYGITDPLLLKQKTIKKNVQ